MVAYVHAVNGRGIGLRARANFIALALKDGSERDVEGVADAGPSEAILMFLGLALALDKMGRLDEALVRLEVAREASEGQFLAGGRTN